MENLPDEKACQKLSKAKAISYLTKVINLLEESKCSADSDVIFDLVQRLSNAYFDYYHKFIDEVCDEYINKNVLAILYKLLTELLTNWEDKTVQKICTLLVNFSSHSEQIASKLKDYKILNFIIDRYLESDFSDLTLCKARRIFKLYLTIIHNFAFNPNNNIDYKENEIKSTLSDIIKSDCDDFFGVISMLILSYLIDDSEISLLSNRVNILRKLLEKIKFTSESPNRSDGFTLVELVYGLHRISLNDDMKIKIDEENAIPILLNILKTHSSDLRVVESILGVIEHLCFNNTILNKLITKYNIEKILKSFMKSKSEKIQKICEGINWKISKLNPGKKIDKPKSKQIFFDAFLSYSHANKEKVQEIRKKLKLCSIRVWFDEEQMRGSCIEAMANGIENSNLFIIAGSSSYADSANCRREAEYALTINKPIIPLVMELKYKARSWLGFIYGCKTYFEFSERRDLDKEMQNLVKEINVNLSGPPDLDEKEKLAIDKKSTPVKSETKSSIEQIKNWSIEEVLNWLERNKLESYKNKFMDKKMDGKRILQLRENYLNSPGFFNSHVEKEFEMGYFDLLTFNEALKFEDLK